MTVTGTVSHTCTKCLHIAKCILKRLYVVNKTLLLYGEFLYYYTQLVKEMLMECGNNGRELYSCHSMHVYLAM